MSKSSWATRAGSDALSQAGPGTVTEPATPQANDTSDLLKSILSPPVLANELGWLGHYKVERLLGRGGMGMVLLAQDTHLQRPVALKIMLPDLASRPGARERFLREARAVAALRDERIVVIYQVGQERDVPYLAMEYLHGQSLEERMRAGPLSIAEIVRIGGEIAKGLAVAHQAGVIHRDVKPGNIFLTRGAVASRDDPASSLDTAAAKVKILDFGLARPVTDDLRLTGSGQFVGTPYFVSPEQARGQTVDARSDLFSLGVVLYNLCTGKLPFAGDSVMAVLTALAVDTPPAMGELRADVPASLEALVGRLLEKDAEKRPASALAVAAALEKIGAAFSALRDTGVQRATAVGLPAMTPPAPAATIAAAPAESRIPRKRWKAMGAALVAFASLTLLALHLFGDKDTAPGGAPPVGPVPAGAPVRIGVLHSRTGTMAISERGVIDAVLLAVEEVNARGGVLGRPLEPVVEDGQSDDDVFSAAAEKLITRHKVVTIFGCWTSASRKAVKPVVERHNNLLMYSVESEGMELSPNIVYGGAAPNQQILPAVRWCVGFLNKRRWFLVGSDCLFPRAANAIVNDEAKTLGCQVVGEEYLLQGTTDVAGVIEKIRAAQPDLIINTLNGDTNVPFFRGLRRAKITPERVPTISFTIDDTELAGLPAKDLVGDLVAGNYFEELERPQNRAFVAAFHKRYGAQRSISDSMQTAYYSVHVWAEAVQAAGSVEPPAILAALKGRRFEAPQGTIRIDPDTLYTVQHVRIGRFRLGADNGAHVEEVFVSPRPVPPEPFPSSRSRQAWEGFLADLQRQWHGRWANPGP